MDGGTADVVVDDGLIVAVDTAVEAAATTEQIDARGGALIPGLWDHHIHLLALAAARQSVVVGPPSVADAVMLGHVLGAEDHRLPPQTWLRAVGYHESVAGALDRARLDALVPGRPMRLQHRSGALWILNSAAIEVLGLEHADRDAIERDARGVPTGRVYGDDRWLRERIGASPPDLADVGALLASMGVTGVTDATPFAARQDLEPIGTAVERGDLPQRVVVMGGPSLADADVTEPLTRGPVKLVLADHALPALADVVQWIESAKDAGRPVAIHTVTRASLALAIAALTEAGALDGTRIEHGSVVPPAMRDELVRLAATVVTQPGFVAERGDEYLADVEHDDLPHLYPCRSLMDAGIPVGGSTDAPFGAPDPWAAMAAAVERTTRRGTVLGPAEAVAPRAALDLFLGRPDHPGGPARRVAEGELADLCLLDAPLASALADLSADHVRATVVGGRVVFDAER